MKLLLYLSINLSNSACVSLVNSFFVAIKGDRFDANTFAKEALEKGFIELSESVFEL